MQHQNQNPITMDFRENRSKVPKFLQELGVHFQTANLQADYIIGNDCFVERKTVADFISSIADGRLFRQVAALAKNCKQALLLLEGGGLYAQGRVPANTIRGAVIWTSVIKRVPVIRTFNEYDTACTLRLLANKISNVQQQNVNFLRQQPKVISPWQRQIKILTQIPGVGLQTAKNILTTFGSIDNMLKAPDIELMGLPGLGKERVKSIRQIFPGQVPVMQTVVDKCAGNGVK